MTPLDPPPHSRNRPPTGIVERVTLLRKVALFEGTPGKVLAAVATLAEELFVEEGTNLLCEGEQGDTLFVVLEGQLVAERSGHHVAWFGPGDVIGEFAVLVSQPRSATVRAVSACTVLQVEKSAIDELLLDYPEVARSIITSLVRRFQERNSSLDQLGHQ
jgi:CRP/FNR family transcriptional regulator, cyclic AMP receptor protein